MSKFAIAAVGAGILLTALPTLSQAADIVFSGYGGALRDAEEKAWFEPFMAANPDVKILYEAGPSPAKLIAQVETGNVTWDLVHVGVNFGFGESDKYLTKIDCSIVECANLQPDKFVTTGYRVPHLVGAVVLTWNKDLFPGDKAPKNWADFFDLKKFPGKRIMMGNLQSFPLEAALAGDGVTPDKLYPMDVDRALAKLDTIKSELTLTTNYPRCVEAVASGDAVMGHCWNGRVYSAIENGAPLAYTWNGSINAAGYLVIPKGAPNADAAMKLLAYMTSTEHNAEVAKYITYGPANIKAVPNIAENVRADINSSNLDDTAIFSGDQWYADNPDVQQRFLDWQSR